MDSNARQRITPEEGARAIDNLFTDGDPTGLWKHVQHE